MGMDKETSHFVNVHEDKIWRRLTTKMDVKERLEFMLTKGSDYVKTWTLHLILDIIEDHGEIGPDEFEYEMIGRFGPQKSMKFVRKVIKEIGISTETKSAVKFVLENLNDILHDFNSELKKIYNCE